ncbi:MAG: choice-of-anchor V domain-containing protein [Thermaurantimonas sp.]|uniref:Reelin domain-containing protein n=1 Tax=Thermaurantimonas aggregans TaxID=2173829 RepID=A0A401XJ51_9FLAO|nr:choice-of-anchor V domain-containing protein [Thermaurantimonas aggregans]MCX8148966.1 T9SS type A sorting domain-containing protein [Thermaurantimonas aggregans]GCD77018.1 hypothetical protein JCM31826_05000 [Thermaurantimonas aggregans]
MIKKYKLTAATALLILLSGMIKSNSNGAFSTGYTGAPIDNGMNCSGCHGGQTSNSTSLITSNIPPTGYVPGTKYQITINAQHPTLNRFGFMLTAQTNTTNPIHVGTWSLLNNQTQLRINNRYVSHTSQGTQGSNNARTWQVEWTAPAAGTGAVAIYAAVNAVNGNGTTSGDQTILGSLIVGESSVSLNETKTPAVRIFPNPVKSEFVQIENVVPFSRVEIFTLDGRLAKKEDFGKTTSATVKVSDLKSGIHLFVIFDEQTMLNTQKIWIP